MISYTQVVGEMGPAPRGYRTHGVHGPRGNHPPAAATPQETTHARQDKQAEGFSAGVL